MVLQSSCSCAALVPCEAAGASRPCRGLRVTSLRVTSLRVTSLGVTVLRVTMLLPRSLGPCLQGVEKTVN